MCGCEVEQPDVDTLITVLDSIKFAPEAEAEQVARAVVSILVRTFDPVLVAVAIYGNDSSTEWFVGQGEPENGNSEAVDWLKRSVNRALEDNRNLAGNLRGSATVLERAGGSHSGSEWPRGEEAVLVVPVAHGHDLLGSIAIGGNHALVRSIPFRLFVSALSNQLAVSLINERLLSMTELRRREAQALNWITQEICSQLALDQVLDAIVTRARELLDTDVAFLALLEEGATQELRMAAAAGVEDPSFLRLSMRVGETLGGLAVSQRGFVLTEDYLADPRFQRGNLDIVVEREGTRSTLGVPVQAGDQVLGVLYVANRRPTTFADDRAELLSSLANSAAVAIKNAQLYGAKERALAELRALHDLTKRQHAALERSRHMHDRLTAAVLDHCGVDGIASILAELIGNPVLVLDSAFHVMARSADANHIEGILESGSQFRSDIAKDLRLMVRERHPIQIATKTVGRERSWIIVPIIAGGEIVGFVALVEENLALAEVDLVAVERAATVLALELTRRQAVLEVEERLRGEFVDVLLSGQCDEAAARVRAGQLDFPLARCSRVAVMVASPKPGIESLGPDAGISALLAAARAAVCRRRPGSLVASRNGHLVVLMVSDNLPGAGSAAVQTLNDVVAELTREGRGWRASAGIGSAVSSIADIALSYRQALRAVEIGTSLHRREAVLSYENLGLYRLLAEVPDRDALLAIASERLASLVEYDRRKGSELLWTLEAYLSHQRNLHATARALPVHLNTLIYRLKRVSELTGVNLGDAEEMLILHLSLRILRMFGKQEATMLSVADPARAHRLQADRG